MDDLILYTLDDYVMLTKAYGYDSQTNDRKSNKRLF